MYSCSVLWYKKGAGDEGLFIWVAHLEVLGSFGHALLMRICLIHLNMLYYWTVLSLRLQLPPASAGHFKTFILEGENISRCVHPKEKKHTSSSASVQELDNNLSLFRLRL